MLPVEPAGAMRQASVIFERTDLGDSLVRSDLAGLSPMVGRVLLLFEESQSVHELRRIIDAPWLPEVLVELERRQLIRRLDPSPQPAAPSETTCADLPFEQRRTTARARVIEDLGELGLEMGQRVGRCATSQELDALLPQVGALIEAVAGHEAARAFRAEMAI